MRDAAAARIAEGINMQMIRAFSARRVLAEVGEGERAPAGAARAPVEAIAAKGTAPAPTVFGGSAEAFELVAPSVRATCRRLPAVLRRIDAGDGRRLAAEAYAAAVEKIGSVAGASAEGGLSDGGAATNDGGVTTRIRHARTIAAVEAFLSGAGVVLRPNPKGGGGRRPITARQLMDALCLEGCDVKSVLTRAGWSGQRRDVAALSRSVESCLEGMARALGLIPDAARLAGQNTALGRCHIENARRAT